MKLTSIIFVTFFFILSNILLGCKPEGNFNDANVVRIGTADSNGRLSSLFGLAKQLNYIEQELDLINTKYQIYGFAGAGPAVNEALASNTIDIGVYADFPAIIAINRGVNIKIIMLDDAFINADIVVRSDSNLHSLKDLVGKKIALPNGTYMQRYFTLLAERNGYKIKDFNIIQMTSDIEPALINGAVDAIVWTENSIKRLQHKVSNIEILYTSKTTPDLAGMSVVVANQNYINQHSDVIRALYKALSRASDYAKDNPKAAEELLAKESNTSVDVIHDIHDFYDLEIFNHRYFVQITEGDKLRLSKTQQFMLDHKILNKPIDIDNWIYSAYENKDF